jgi:hypothetical protein
MKCSDRIQEPFALRRAIADGIGCREVSETVKVHLQSHITDFQSSLC